MPIGGIKIGDQKKSEVDRFGGKLAAHYGQIDEDYKQAARDERHPVTNFVLGGVKGVARTAEATANLPFDVAGASDRMATFSDFIDDNPNSNAFFWGDLGGHIASSLVGGYKVTKGAQAKFGKPKMTRSAWHGDKTKGIPRMKKKEREIFLLNYRKSQDFKKTKVGRLYETGKVGLGMGGVAEGVGWQGHGQGNEMLMTEWIYDFFTEDGMEEHLEFAIKGHSKYTKEYPESWVDIPTEELADRFHFSFANSVDNVSGRVAFAAEGMLFGSLFNYAIAGLKVSMRAAGKQGKPALERILYGKDVAAGKAIRKVANQTRRVEKELNRIDPDNPLNKKIAEEELASPEMTKNQVVEMEKKLADLEKKKRALNKALAKRAKDTAKKKQKHRQKLESNDAAAPIARTSGEADKAIGATADRMNDPALYKEGAAPAPVDSHIPARTLGETPEGSVFIDIEKSLEAVVKLQRHDKAIFDNWLKGAKKGSGKPGDSPASEAYLERAGLEKDQIADLTQLRELLDIFGFTPTQLKGLMGVPDVGSKTGATDALRAAGGHWDLSDASPAFNWLSDLDKILRRANTGKGIKGAKETKQFEEDILRITRDLIEENLDEAGGESVKFADKIIKKIKPIAKKLRSKNAVQREPIKGLARLQGGEVVLDQKSLREYWDNWTKEGGKSDASKEVWDTPLQMRIPQDVFDDIDDFSRFVLERERLKAYFPRGVKETAEGYALRIEKATIDAARRKGIGNFYKYEFDPKAAKHLQLTDDEAIGILFKSGNTPAGRKAGMKIAHELRNLGRGIGKKVGKAGRPLSEIMSDASRILNLDATFIDTHSKYFTGRLMSFFMHNMREGMSQLSDDAASWTAKDVDTLAAAIGYVRDPHRKGALKLLQDDVMDGIADVADSNTMGRDAMTSRIVENFGDGRHLYKAMETTLDEAASQDVKVLKEAYIRMNAYKMDMVIQMERIRQIVYKITDGSLDEFAAGGQMGKYADEIERSIHKASTLQKLGTASGRLLRANDDHHKEMFSKMEQLLMESGPNGDNAKQMFKHANAMRSIFDSYAHEAVDGAIAAKKFLAQTSSGIEIHNEYWLNALLSGTKTQSVNFISTGLHMYYKPFEGYWGARALGEAGEGAKRAMIDQFLKQGMINLQVIRVLAAFGLNKAGRMGKLITDDTYHKNRTALYKRGQGGPGDNLAQATQSVAGGRKAFRSGEGTLSDNSDLFDVAPGHKITSDILPDAVDDVSMLGQPVGQWAKETLDWAGNIIRLPMRSMIGIDELFKQISFRANSYARLTMEATTKHGMTDADAIARFVADGMDGLIRNTGKRHTGRAIREEAIKEHQKLMSRYRSSGEEVPTKYLDQSEFVDNYRTAHFDPKKSALADSAQAWADDVTYTRGLDDDLKELQADGRVSKTRRAIGKEIQDAVHNHPWFRLVVPFTKVPINLVKFPLQRMSMPFLASPKGTMLGKRVKWLENLHLKYQADMASGDPIRMAAAQGRIVAGRFYWMTTLGLAAGDVITGGGSKDQAQFNNDYATGWRPYSFKINGKYYSYARLDPWATGLGFAADVYGTAKRLGEEGDFEEHGLLALMLSGAVAMSNNMADKIWLGGMNRVLKATINPERELPNLLKKQAASYIPKIISQWTPLTDDNYMKKSYGVLEGIMAKVPSLASKVNPQRNFLGEKVPAMWEESILSSAINPMMISEATKDPILNEIASIRFGFSPPSPRINGSPHLDMRKFKNEKGQSAWDRYQENIGKVKINGVGIREAYEKLFASVPYRKATVLAERKLLIHQGTHKDQRVKAIKGIMGKYREYAKLATLEEYPNLARAKRGYDYATQKQLQELVQ